MFVQIKKKDIVHCQSKYFRNNLDHNYSQSLLILVSRRSLSDIYLVKMQSVKYALKFEYFRKGGSWEDMAKMVCTWVNTNINLCRLVGITSVLCSANNENMVNLYYNEGHIAKDILGQTDHLVLAYEIFSMPKNVKHSWLVHNQRIVGKIAEVAQRGQIFAVNSLQHDNNHKTNVTIVWYKRMK